MTSKRADVRLAKPEDAAGILLAHYSAVHSTAARDYAAEITSEWSAPVTPERVEEYLRHSFPAETTVVALVDDKIAGFGSIVESISE